MSTEQTIFFARPSSKGEDVHAVKLKMPTKTLYLLLAPVFLLIIVASLALPTLFMIAGDTFLLGVLFLLILLPLDYFLYKRCRDNLKLKQGEVYFNVTTEGIFYTRYNDLSGGVSHYQVLWAELIGSPENGAKTAIGFVNNGYKNNTKNLVIYTVNQTGDTKQNLIPLHEIKKFKQHWDITRAILMQVASLQRPELKIFEEVYYCFNINPETFTFQKKSLRRRLANFVGVTTALILICWTIYGASIGFTTIEMSGFWFAMAMVALMLVILLIIAGAVVIFSRIPFFRNSFPTYTLVAYK
ncbi:MULTISPECIES: hypothetical protein [unclassified Serratia (in: enterobacteria)]|uniref:hypothetical protein n=1 Tax=unclassified Serratia (in: enterobacteria) TaxID=2647522 RepID=UPI0004698F64|nr:MULTISPECIES: hypothetical protein [unclassified Serratia (in: enterobacteria)]